MEGYNAASCSALAKPFYAPIEAAIRWCNLIGHEVAIIQAVSQTPDGIPALGMFPQWPCLKANAEKILLAMIEGEMRSGRNGRTVNDGEHVTPSKRTVKHADLKEWMSKHEPGQKPAFLFDEVERSTHAGISRELFLALKAERDELKAAVDAQASTEKPLGTTERQTLLRLVIGMAVRGYKFDPAAKRNTAVTDIADDLAAVGVKTDPDTVRKFLKEAAETVLPTDAIKP